MASAGPSFSCAQTRPVLDLHASAGCNHGQLYRSLSATSTNHDALPLGAAVFESVRGNENAVRPKAAEYRRTPKHFVQKSIAPTLFCDSFWTVVILQAIL